MKKLGLGILLAGILLVGVARADDAPLSVQRLLEACDSPVSSTDYGFCHGYIIGLGAMMTVNAAMLLKAPQDELLRQLSICGEMTGGALVQTFLNWARAHPEAWTQGSDDGVVVALHQMWPCK